MLPMMATKWCENSISRDKSVIFSYIGRRLSKTTYQPIVQFLAPGLEAAIICVEETGYLTLLLTASHEEAFIA